MSNNLFGVFRLLHDAEGVTKYGLGLASVRRSIGLRAGRV
jgi:hypothetical protein